MDMAQSLQITFAIVIGIGILMCAVERVADWHEKRGRHSEEQPK